MTEPAISTPIAALPSSATPRRRTRWLARCAMMFGGLAAGLGMAELVFAHRDGGAFPHLNVYVADPELGVRLQPGATESVAFGGNPVTHVRINRDGFRGDELPPPGGDDVAVVGDSQVFGLGVEQDETFSARLAGAIRRPVINAGVPTYGPAEYRAVIAEQLAGRHPKTVVLTINLANDLFEAQHSNRQRHAVWDGWAVRRETAPSSVTSFPGRELLYRRSHLFFALRKWWHGGAAEDRTDERGVASEGTWRDIVQTGEQVQSDRRALDQAHHDRLSAVTAVHRDLERAEGKVDELIRRHADADDFSLAVARASPGDIVGNPFAESARSTLATADQIAQAALVRAGLRDELARWARSHTTAEARDAAASLDARDQALARLTALDVQDLRAALEPPLAGYLRDVQQLVEHGGARLVVLILPIDVQVSPAEWRKYGAPQGIDERSEKTGGGDPAGSAGGAGGSAPRGIDERSEKTGGGDPAGSAGGAGGSAPRGIDERSEKTGGGDPAGSAGGAGGSAPRGIDMGPSLALTAELAALCRSLGVSVLDATPVLAAAEPGAFLDKDIHMTPKGHAAVAAALAATLGETPPARVVASQRSPVPLPDVFKHAAEVIVTGSSEAGCETKQVREWLRIQCARTENAWPVDAQVSRDDGHEAMVLVMPAEVSLLVPVVEGRELTATVSWTDRTRVLHVAWPAGATRPTLAFDRPVARHPAAATDRRPAFRSPVERAICDCWQTVFGGGERSPLRDDDLVCRGAYGAADPACVDRYGRPSRRCPELLACTRRDPASPP